ncbi:hypothetical protein WT60_02415 [Burkholderia sp. MSMB617WGS]|nr:hypothetical protein WT60_02415 [Burkholderia sp. MSMB617WGS]
MLLALEVLVWPAPAIVAELFFPVSAIAPAFALPLSFAVVAVYFLAPRTIVAVTPPDSASAFAFVSSVAPLAPATPIPPPAANAPPSFPEPLAVEVELCIAEAVAVEPAGVAVLFAADPATDVELLV